MDGLFSQRCCEMKDLTKQTKNSADTLDLLIRGLDKSAQLLQDGRAQDAVELLDQNDEKFVAPASFRDSAGASQQGSNKPIGTVQRLADLMPTLDRQPTLFHVATVMRRAARFCLYAERSKHLSWTGHADDPLELDSKCVGGALFAYALAQAALDSLRKIKPISYIFESAQSDVVDAAVDSLRRWCADESRCARDELARRHTVRAGTQCAIATLKSSHTSGMPHACTRPICT